MRIFSALTITLLACGAAFAEPNPESATYVDGNVSGVSPHTGGTLMFSDAKAMHLRTAATNVTVPYENITKASLGATRMHSHEVPMYKIWAFHKRMNETTETRYLTLAFKSDAGDDQTMTLELAKAAVPDVMATIQSHARPGVVPADSVPPVKLTNDQVLAAKPAEAPTAPWWGDDYWKTARNQDKWNQEAAKNSTSSTGSSANSAGGQ